MRLPLFLLSFRAGMVVPLLLIAALLLAAGCAQPAGFSAEPVTPREETTDPEELPLAPLPSVTETGNGAVIVEKPDSTKIVVTYTGSPDADLLMELSTTVTDSRGTGRLQSMGSRLGTTPVQRGATVTISGPFHEPAHVVCTGSFADGSSRTLLDLWI